MGAYMYPIQINKFKLWKLISRKVKMYDTHSISLKEITDNVKEGETFYINYNEGLIEISGKRLETDEEQKQRVQKEEKYMENYEIFQLKHSKKL